MRLVCERRHADYYELTDKVGSGRYISAIKQKQTQDLLNFMTGRKFKLPCSVYINTPYGVIEKIIADKKELLATRVIIWLRWNRYAHTLSPIVYLKKERK